jgi:CysZ protein
MAESSYESQIEQGDGGLVPAPFYVVKGALFIRAHRILWKYAAAPLAISVVVLGVAYAASYWLFLRLMSPLAAEAWYWQVLYYVAAVMVTILLLVLVFFLFSLLATAIAAPFNELISEKTESLVRGIFQDTPFSVTSLLRDSARGIGHSLAILGTYIGVLVVSLPLLLIPVVGHVLFAAIGTLLSAYMFAYEFLGCSMDRRRYSLAEKRKFIRSHLRSSLGFGLGIALTASIPFVNVLLLPAAAVGGTLLFLELSRNDATSSPIPD